MSPRRTVGACALLAGLAGGPVDAGAQASGVDFAPIPDRTIVEPPLSPAYVSDLTLTLDAVLSRQKDAAKWADDATKISTRASISSWTRRQQRRRRRRQSRNSWRHELLG